jgi:hypothetical protein
MKVYVYTNNTHGRFRLTPDQIAKLEANGFTPLKRYGDNEDDSVLDKALYRDESNLHTKNAHLLPVECMTDPRFQGRLVIDIPVDDEEKAWATARWKFYNTLGVKNPPIADCQCCGPSERFDTDDYYGDDD